MKKIDKEYIFTNGDYPLKTSQTKYNVNYYELFVTKKVTSISNNKLIFNTYINRSNIKHKNVNNFTYTGEVDKNEGKNCFLSFLNLNNHGCKIYNNE